MPSCPSRHVIRVSALFWPKKSAFTVQAAASYAIMLAANDITQTFSFALQDFERNIFKHLPSPGSIANVFRIVDRELKADVTDKSTLDGLFDATFARKSSEEREAIKDRYTTRARVLNAADPLKAKAKAHRVPPTCRSTPVTFRRMRIRSTLTP